MIHLRPASLAAFTRDAAEALAAAVVDRATENRRLRAANYGLQWDVTRLTQIADQLASANRELTEDLATTRRALAQAVNHPSVRASDFDFGDDEPDEIPTGATLYVPPAERGKYIDAVAVLDRDDLALGDLLFEGGWTA